MANNFTTFTKSKVINLCLVLFSLIGFLEWGSSQKMFLWEVELELFTKLFIDPLSVIHPFTLMPLAGQLMLVYTLIQEKPSKRITYIAIACIGILFALMFFIGAMGLNIKILGSTLPFIITALIAILHYRKNTGNK